MKYDPASLAAHVDWQLRHLMNASISTYSYQEEVIQRCEKCFSASSDKYYSADREFSPYHTGQYLVYLYFLSNTMFKRDGHGGNAEKVYCLNKLLHAVDIFFQVELPEIFGVEHPLSSVMGRAKYSDLFFFYQGCTVGGSNGYYPVIGRNVRMYSDSKIVGRSRIGNNVILSANAYVINTDIPDNSIVFGQADQIHIKRMTEEEILTRMHDIWSDQAMLSTQEKA